MRVLTTKKELHEHFKWIADGFAEVDVNIDGTRIVVIVRPKKRYEWTETLADKYMEYEFTIPCEKANDDKFAVNFDDLKECERSVRAKNREINEVIDRILKKLREVVGDVQMQ